MNTVVSLKWGGVVPDSCKVGNQSCCLLEGPTYFIVMKYEIKGIRHLIVLGLPEQPQFYADHVNLITTGIHKCFLTIVRPRHRAVWLYRICERLRRPCPREGRWDRKLQPDAKERQNHLYVPFVNQTICSTYRYYYFCYYSLCSRITTPCKLDPTVVAK
jgi:hypothetical protein